MSRNVRNLDLDDQTIAVIGLGYVGLPLAVEFGRKRRVVGFDIRHERIAELQGGRDATLEVDAAGMAAAELVTFTTNPEALKACGVFIVTVPTPIDRANRPDLGPLVRASETVGKAISEGAVVIYESTVYPGCTRDICVPILERLSGLTLNE
ncbi:MAG TPA: Vi polysaccharide biosynthesis UDP-N-acetylglucosamine C-6 dehydrogenase TviB, partial [Aurantimonas coralicida]|nr:Vi polysaccharide biosynthesis UDP-N-acetylglucosamine C-6 dehydrogenase TviB [Aurantimonas coralicida]